LDAHVTGRRSSDLATAYCRFAPLVIGKIPAGRSRDLLCAAQGAALLRERAAVLADCANAVREEEQRCIAQATEARRAS
jgi:hypothetical protein